jgi:hypothetical protein
MNQGNLVHVGLSVMENLHCPRSLTVAILLRYEEWNQLVELTTDPAHHLDAYSFSKAYQATEFLRKFDGLPTSYNKEQLARESFVDSERQCLETNLRLSRFLYGVLETPEDLRLDEFFTEMKKTISDWLGPFNYSFVEEAARFGPGSTYSDRGRLNTVPDKITSVPAMTPSSWSWIRSFSQTAWAQARATASPAGSCILLDSVPGNRFLTVPKDARKVRGIAVEPSFNIYFQLGVGALLRERLKRSIGLDIAVGQEVNRSMISGKPGKLATIDLSSASDTVSKSLVKLLLPQRWFHHLDNLRSPKTRVDGRWWYLEKFSSMGNGFTFELETLIFASIVCTVYMRHGIQPVYGENFSVFGDDIIIDSTLFPEVISVLRFLGFTPNPRKTFCEGNFRESCGEDVFDGFSVTPVRLDGYPSNPIDFFSLHNKLRRIEDYFDCDLSRIRRFLIFQVPARLRLTVPSQLGDTGFHDPSGVVRRRVRHWCHQVLIVVPMPFTVSWSCFKDPVMFAAALYGIPSSLSGRAVFSARGDAPGYLCKWVSYFDFV